MTAQFRLYIVMISQKPPFTESDVNEKTSILCYLWRKTIVHGIRNCYHEENMKFVKARYFMAARKGAFYDSLSYQLVPAAVPSFYCHRLRDFFLEKEIPLRRHSSAIRDSLFQPLCLSAGSSRRQRRALLLYRCHAHRSALLEWKKMIQACGQKMRLWACSLLTLYPICYTSKVF